MRDTIALLVCVIVLTPAVYNPYSLYDHYGRWLIRTARSIPLGSWREHCPGMAHYLAGLCNPYMAHL